MAEPASTDEAAALTLQWSELDVFLAAHPTACLVDVREATEHLASHGIQYGAWAAINLPLSTLTTDPPAWTQRTCAASPLVLVCRSGKRSLQAAQWLHTQGQVQVRHVHGGLALRPGAGHAVDPMASSAD